MYQASGAQPHYRQGSYSGGPLQKKPRGNPIITRYPPPPGYQGPAAAGWQQAQQASAHVGQPSYPGYQQFPISAQTYAPYQVQPFFQSYPPVQEVYFAGAQVAWQPVATPQSAPAFATHGAFRHSGFRRHSSAPHSTSTALVLDGNGDPLPPSDFPSGYAEDLEEAFDGECYFARHPDEINPDLSLGVIEWTAPLPTKRALPSTFAEAEVEAIAVPPERENDYESVSDYFKWPQREEAFLSVRQTDGWKDVKDSLIYREFAAVCKEIITMTELLARYRYQFDAQWAAGDRDSSSPESSTASTPELAPVEPNADRRRVGSRANSTGDHRTASHPDAFDDMDHMPTSQHRRSSTHSRNGSTSSLHATKITRPKPLPPVRDKQQEDILAALGVTGSPKLVYQTPGPAFGPPPRVSSEQGRHSRSNSANSALGSHGNQPRRPQSSTSRHVYDNYVNDFQRGRSRSTHSQLSATASDFDMEPEPDPDVTPKPARRQYTPNDSRKRSYADTIAGAMVEPIYEDDEDTPKQRRKQPRVDSARA